MKVQKFESVKLTVEAVQYTGDNYSSLQDFTRSGMMWNEGVVSIMTKEGKMVVSNGDYVVKEPFPNGDRDFYPVKAEIFAKRYRPAGQQSSFMLWGRIAIVVTAIIMGFGFGILYAIEFYKH